MAMQIDVRQIVDPQYWGGITQMPHLAKLGGFNPVYLNKTLDSIYEINNGVDNFVSIADRFPVETVTNPVYRWRLAGQSERVYSLIKASLTSSGAQVSGTDKAGINHTVFFMWFAEKAFEAISSIYGENPEKYELRIVDEPVNDSTGWRYKVSLYTGDPSSFVAVADLAANTRWSEGPAYVERDFSIRGNSVKHSSHMEFENTFSMIRKYIESPGSMVDVGSKNYPLAITFKDANTGKTQTTWIEKLLYDFHTQYRRDKALAYLFGKSNKSANGTYIGKGESGNTIYKGWGLFEQINLGNTMRYNNFSIDSFARWLMDLSVGKLSDDSTHFMVSTGKYGLLQAHIGLSNKASQFPWITSGHNFEKGKDGSLILNEGQITGYTFVNGIKVSFVYDSSKDSNMVYKQVHKEGGLVSSYVYDILDIGTNNGSSNIVRVNMAGSEEITKYIPGMRHPFGAKVNNGMDMAATSVDGWALHQMADLSICVKNVLRTGRYMPSIF